MGEPRLARHQKKAARLNAWLIFLDESGFLMAPLVRRTWAPRGRTPLLFHRAASHQKVSAIAVLCVAPDRDRLRLFFRLHPDRNINADLVVQFLRELLKHLDGNVVMVWDRLQAHRAAWTQAFIRETFQIHTVYFPPYAPELNPVEYLWSYLKGNPLANEGVPELESLARLARYHGRSVQNQPHLLRAFLEHSPLSLRLL